MINFDEYVHFVTGAKIAGQRIEYKIRDGRHICYFIPCILDIDWNWYIYFYRIKLPKGYEYVIENGEIAFREPKKGEGYLSPMSWGYQAMLVVGRTLHCPRKYPIIKRITK